MSGHHQAQLGNNLARYMQTSADMLIVHAVLPIAVTGAHLCKLYYICQTAKFAQRIGREF